MVRHSSRRERVSVKRIEPADSEIPTERGLERALLKMTDSVRALSPHLDLRSELIFRFVWLVSARDMMSIARCIAQSGGRTDARTYLCGVERHCPLKGSPVMRLC
jgi:hypothetical protein